MDSQSSTIVEQGVVHMLDHSPTFVMRMLPSGCPLTETLSNRAAAQRSRFGRHLALGQGSGSDEVFPPLFLTFVTN